MFFFLHLNISVKHTTNLFLLCNFLAASKQQIKISIRICSSFTLFPPTCKTWLCESREWDTVKLGETQNWLLRLYGTWHNACWINLNAHSYVPGDIADSSQYHLLPFSKRSFISSRISLCIFVFFRNSDCRVRCQPLFFSRFFAASAISPSRPFSMRFFLPEACSGSSGLSRFEDHQNPNNDIDVWVIAWNKHSLYYYAIVNYTISICSAKIIFYTYIYFFMRFFSRI